MLDGAPSPHPLSRGACHSPASHKHTPQFQRAAWHPWDTPSHSSELPGLSLGQLGLQEHDPGPLPSCPKNLLKPKAPGSVIGLLSPKFQADPWQFPDQGEWAPDGSMRAKGPLLHLLPCIPAP